MSETSPLLPNHTPPPREPTRSAWYLLLLALPLGGLQVAWSVEFSAGSSYLLSLGLSKQLLALVWFAGPLMGIVVQPSVGALSDDCRLPWGRRRPYLLGGTVVTVLSMTSLARVRELAGDVAGGGVQAAAVVGVYVLNFGLNVVEASGHALITDCAPRHQQEAANGMASRSMAVGGLVGFLAGSIDLTTHFPFLGHSHFKVLCAVAGVLLGFSVLVNASLVTEQDPNERYGAAAEKSVGDRLWSTLWGLSPQIKTLFAVQAFACFAFFPVLFYGSVYVAEIYAAPYLRENPHMTPEELDALYEEGMRKGTVALAWNAAVMLLSTVLAPLIVAPTYDRTESRTPSTSSSRSSVMSEPYNNGDSGVRPGRTARIRRLLYLRIPRPTLKLFWITSLILQAAALLAAPFIHSVDATIVLIAALGYTWALTAWAPFAIIGAETHAGPDLRPDNDAHPGRRPANSDGAGPEDGSGSSMRDRVGVVLGIHNVVVCTAQAASTLVSLGVFGILQKPRGQPGDASFAVLFGVSGIAGVLAVCLAGRIREPGRCR